MNSPTLKWSVDIGLLIAFLVCVITGLFKWTLLMRTLGLTGYIFPLALMSDIHDWSGIALVVLVGIHLLLNGRWIVTMTKKILAGKNS
jgi:putative Mn2+ efflux pump MntP